MQNSKGKRNQQHKAEQRRL